MPYIIFITPTAARDLEAAIEYYQTKTWLVISKYSTNSNFINSKYTHQSKAKR